MWQRIQTVWLVLVALLMAVFAFQDIAVFTLPGGTFCFLDNWHIYNGTDGVGQHNVWGIGALSIVSAVLALRLVFLYKRRMLQMRFTVLLPSLAGDSALPTTQVLGYASHWHCRSSAFPCSI